MILVLRLLADYLWQFKEVAVLVAGVGLFQCGIYFCLRKFHPRAILAAVPFLAYLGLQLLFRPRPPADALIDVGKILSAFMVFFLGALSPPAAPLMAGLASMSGLLLVAVSGSYLTGSGFKQWGNVTTFSGGFYFKTDLAAFLSFSAVYLMAIRRSLPWLLGVAWWGVLAYFTIRTNARIYYLIFPCVTVFLIRGTYRSPSLVSAGWNMILAGLGLVLIVIGIMTLADRSGFLLFDTSRGLFSGRLTQGRSVMWTEILGWYVRDFNLTQKLFGGGFGADQVMSREIFSNSPMRGLDSHNLYLTLLVNLGVVGLLLFFAFVSSVLFQYMRIVSRWRTSLVHDQYLCAFAGAAMILFLSGVTNNSLVYAQMTWPFFYFAGTLFSHTSMVEDLEAAHD
jgi:hypothetical protein